MSSSKVFRLFVSSTFSDFSIEREVLQTEVFPRLRKYCLEKGGYLFQPIDLRWGVGHEAQLDQKTLDLCLQEVRTCKVHPAPNFIILAGDRYGWVPLPYAIEIPEFDAISKELTEESKLLLSEWYIKDNNQIPPAYTLKARTGKYEDFALWEEKENQLRVILQNAVEKAMLPDADKKKYFLSATEAEVIEGILGYSVTENEFHRNLREKHGLKAETDRENVWAFIRSIRGDIQDTIYSDNKAEEVKRFTSRLIDMIPSVLHCDTHLDADGAFDTSYLNEFKDKSYAFLKNRIDRFIETTGSITLLEAELEGQRAFKQIKLHNFQGQEASRKLAQDYINGVEREEIHSPNKPFVFYGPSGRGKSSLMARIIDECEDHSEYTLVYRFIGATPDSTRMAHVFYTIFNELNLETDFFLGEDEAEGGTKSVEDMFLRLRQELANFGMLDKKVVICIVSLDQLAHNEDFVFLPGELPSNLKILFSVLHDENYPSENSYIEALDKRDVNFFEVPLPEDPVALLNSFLSDTNRRLTEKQMSALELDTLAASPFYLYTASLILQYIKSSESIEKLPEEQHSLIKLYIEKLNTQHYHNKALIERVLSYIHISDFGLSESEMLQLLSCDSALVKELAPDTWHKNSSGDLPVVIWSRLLAHLKPFIKTSAIYGEDLLNFFFRDFDPVVAESKNLKDNYHKLIQACQQKIVEVQDQPYYYHRWGELYRHIVVNCHFLFPDKEYQKENFSFIGKLANTEWVQDFADLFTAESQKGLRSNNPKRADVYLNAQLTLYKVLGERDESFSIEYIHALNQLSKLNNAFGHYDKAFSYSQKAVEAATPLYHKTTRSPENARIYGNSLEYLADVYISKNEFDTAIKLEEQVLSLRRENETLYPGDFLVSVAMALNNLAIYYRGNGQTRKALSYAEESQYLLKKLYDESPDDHLRLYLTALQTLSKMQIDLNRGNDALASLEEAVRILAELYDKAPQQWERMYSECLHDYGMVLEDRNQSDLAVDAFCTAATLRRDLYNADPGYFAYSYVNTLNSLSWAYMSIIEPDYSIACAELAYPIAKEGYEQNKEHWANIFCLILSSLSRFLQHKGDIDKAMEHMTESVEVSEYFVSQSIYDSISIHANALRGLSCLQSEVKQYKAAIQTAEKDLSIIRGLQKHEPLRWLGELYASLKNISSIYLDMQKYEESLFYVDQACEEVKHGYDASPEVWMQEYAGLLKNKTRLLYNLDRIDHAKAAIAEAISLTRKAFNDKTFSPMKFSNLLLEKYRVMKPACDAEEMKELCIEMLSIQKEGYDVSPEKWSGRYISGLNAISGLLRDTRQFEDLIPYLKEGIRVCSDRYPDDPRHWLGTYVWFLHSLGTCYADLGNCAKGEEYIQKAIDLIEAHEGPSNEDTHYLSEYVQAKMGYLQLKSGFPQNAELKLDRAVKVISEYYSEHPVKYRFHYVFCLIQQAHVKLKLLKIDEARKAIQISKNMLSSLCTKNEAEWIYHYIEVQLMDVEVEQLDKNSDACITLPKELTSVISAYYQKNPKMWEVLEAKRIKLETHCS